MSQIISIARKDGTKVNCNSDGNVWLLLDKSGGPLIGTIINGVCTIYHIYGVDENTKHYLPVDRLILKYAKRLGIDKVRLQYTSYKETRVGKVLRVKYGYISQRHFGYLLTHRKESLVGHSHMVLLLKKSDFIFKKV